MLFIYTKDQSKDLWAKNFETSPIFTPAASATTDNAVWKQFYRLAPFTRTLLWKLPFEAGWHIGAFCSQCEIKDTFNWVSGGAAKNIDDVQAGEEVSWQGKVFSLWN